MKAQLLKFLGLISKTSRLSYLANAPKSRKQKRSVIHPTLILLTYGIATLVAYLTFQTFYHNVHCIEFLFDYDMEVINISYLSEIIAVILEEKTVYNHRLTSSLKWVSAWFPKLNLGLFIILATITWVFFTEDNLFVDVSFIIAECSAEMLLHHFKHDKHCRFFKTRRYIVKMKWWFQKFFRL